MSHFGHIALRVSDLAAALAFYEELMPAFWIESDAEVERIAEWFTGRCR